MSDWELKKKIKRCADEGLELAKQGEYDKATPLLTFACENDDVYSMVNLGHLYELIKEYDKAFYWNKKAADHNNPTGIYNLLICYQFGKGVEPNGEEAIKLADKLIELGRIDEGYFKKAIITKNGCGNLTGDPYKAFKIALEGAEKIMSTFPNPSSGDDCECVLEVGIMYEFGRGVEADRKKTMKYYEYCSLCEHEVGMFNYAQCLNYIDENDAVSKKKTFKIYKTLFGWGYSDAGFELVKLYTSKNNIVEQDDHKGIILLAKSLRQNNFDGHYDEAIQKYKELCPEDFDDLISGRYSRTIDSNE